MGLKGSKSSAEARAFLMGLDSAGKSNLFCKLRESLFTVRAVEYVEMADTGHTARRKKQRRSHWTHYGQGAPGLVYVVDDPTGGVWMKPKESSDISRKKNA
ncbi:ADP-ribosylation factor-like protein 14 [Megalops cyprinoides]|uniref:ADP-ribosylation factor-like protein 14 n=1 Tax=Megalops cyprinoides TaxID=118141 RepID=UPI001863CCFC|nr:ADP-ribosylation factor-like protein 14 [Megalops cyprinoides]